MSNLSIRQIRDILDANGTNYSDCIEKEDFVRKLEQVRSGAKKDTAFHADKGAAPNPGFKGFGGASRSDHNRSESPPPPYSSSSDSNNSRSNSSSNSNNSQRSHQRRGSGSKSSSREESSSSSSNNNSSEPEAIIKRVSSTTDYYKILGISRSASEEEVKKAYKKLALKLHPDKCKLPGAEEAFKKLAGAFNCLGNSDKRNVYDHSGSDPSVGAGGPGGAGGIDPNDIFRAFFGGGGGPMPGGMHFQFGGNGFNGFEQFFQQQQHQRPRHAHQRRPQEEQHVEEQHSLTSLLRFAPIVFLLLPQLTSVVTSVIRSPWMLLPIAFLVPSKLQKPLFAAAAIIFIMNLI